MSSTRNNFHQSTRVASDNGSLSGRAPLTSYGKSSTSSSRSQAGTAHAAVANSSSPDRRYQHHKQIFQHHDAPKNYSRSCKENVPSQYNAVISSESTSPCLDYPKGKGSLKLLRSEQVVCDRHRHHHRHRHLDDTYSYSGRENDHIEVPMDSFHRAKDHHYSMYPQSNQYHYNVQVEHAPWRPLRTTPSPTNHSVVTNVDASSVQGSSSNGSIVDHTYRDFSGVPPSKEDLERYKNKKGAYNRRKKDKKEKPKPTQDSSSSNDSTKDDKEETKRTSTKKRGRGNKVGKSGNDAFVGFMGTNFPARLHDLLSHENGISDTITWLPHGRSWIVRDKKKFLESVAPSHFQISKFESFTRQVNGWGFKRITQGPDINSYYHELFLKGMPHLIQWMKRPPSSGSSGKRKPRADPKDEPNFYDIGAMYPIPDYYDENGGRPFYGSVREKSCLPRDADKRNREEGLEQHMHQYHYAPWDYPVEGHTDYYQPTPKRLRSSSMGHHNGIQHGMSFDESWNQAPRKTLQHPNDMNFYHYNNYSESFAKEPAPMDVTDHTSPSKNHWHSFCEALSHSEDEENKQVTNENEGPLTNVVESIDFEPHSLYDFTPVTDFRKNRNVAPGPYHNEWYDHHPAYSCNHEYHGDHRTPPRMPKNEDFPNSLTSRNIGGNRHEKRKVL